MPVPRPWTHMEVSQKENGYKMTSEQFANAITDKTKCLILNSPNNPTGAVYSKEEIDAIAKIAQDKGIYVISDEIYEKLIYENEKHYSIAQYSPEMKELTIIINGMSKTYSMTGWRIGYLAAPQKIAKAISSMQSHTTSNACSITQYASTTALTDAEKFLNKLKEQGIQADILKINMVNPVPDGAVEIAKQYAQDGKIVTFGVKPDYPETGFGYINNVDNRFVEKPDLELAKKYGGDSSPAFVNGVLSKL